ncbi:MAG: MAPEG family protein [Alphaproteobacteria bacterium]|jgi:uncharacterized MAPEG superfamily protein|nr:MAPEG family protein [Alphaproteobacteria bacterium]MDP6565017.1 MAPEG family protein [Alphaproteobacteria bacterium]MDP6811954.1 MAPEG family protein [Alphaproteobacteria bacterium]|tara:strand:- start:11 stop:418 length:408 start_codon:yes stop_codon:yes gene_type:complete
MGIELTMELRLLAYISFICILLWIPYSLTVIKTRGPVKAAGYPSGITDDLPDFGKRAQRAHLNLVENLAPFAALVLVAHAIGVSTTMTVLGAQLFFWARVVHAGCALAGIPIVRTVAFVVGIVGNLLIFGAILYP